MNSSEYKISLDIHEINSQHLLYCKQGDTQRKIIATLVEESELYHIAEDCTAVFTAFKPDGKVIFNQAHIVGDTIVYEFTEQTANVSGKLDCELRLYGYDNALITSPRFTLVAHPTVYVDVVESKDEVNVLTALISEATELIDSVNTKLNNGEFIPKLSIGKVTTLPAGSNATAEFTGSGEAPVLNLGIPQGDEGQAESLIPDSELSEDSTKPVQNKVITNALKTLSQKTENKLETKVDKAEGMGLSANSFTDEYKETLDSPLVFYGEENPETDVVPLNADTLQGYSVDALVNKIYPVGSIYMSVNSTSPAALFGGTWERIKDTFLLSAGDTYSAGAAGGEAVHTLTVDEMPSHNHGTWADQTNSNPNNKYIAKGTEIGDTTKSTGYTGGDQPHNNMPPYLAVYVWKRTA